MDILDILPFGTVYDAKGVILWPVKNEMSIVGFEETFKNSIEISFINSSKSIQVTSLTGLAVKQISWSDSSDRRKEMLRTLI